MFGFLLLFEDINNLLSATPWFTWSADDDDCPAVTEVANTGEADERPRKLETISLEQAHERIHRSGSSSLLLTLQLQPRGEGCACELSLTSQRDPLLNIDRTTIFSFYAHDDSPA